MILLGLIAAASTTDAPIHKKMFGSGFTTLIISNKEMEDIMKIVKSLEDSVLLINGVIETIRNEAKEQKEGFLGMLLGTLGASLLGNLLAGKGAIATTQGRGTITAGEGIIREVENTKFGILKYKSIIRKNLNLTVLIQEIIYPK